METFQHLMGGFATALSPLNLLFATIGCILGTLIGVLPGLGPAAGTALLIPITFKLDPTAARCIALRSSPRLREGPASL